jgi:hypothetical protein
MPLPNNQIHVYKFNGLLRFVDLDGCINFSLLNSLERYLNRRIRLYLHELPEPLLYPYFYAAPRPIIKANIPPNHLYTLLLFSLATAFPQIKVVLIKLC